MSYDRQFLSLDWGFTVDGSSEIAVTGLNYSEGPGWISPTEALAEIAASGSMGQDLITALATLMDTPALGWSTYSKLRTVKVAAINAAGHYLGEPFVFEDTTPATGDYGPWPPQSTCVLSLRSGFTFGGANYGRMYLPHSQPGLASGSPLMSTGTAGVIVAAGKVFVNTVTARLNAATTDTVDPTIMTNVTGNPSKKVTKVAVGLAVDTQRRRRNKLTETPQTLTL